MCGWVGGGFQVDNITHTDPLNMLSSSVYLGQPSQLGAATKYKIAPSFVLGINSCKAVLQVS